MQIKKEKQIKTKKRTQKSSKKHSKQQPLHRIEKEKFPHFRYYKKSKHPALIVGEQINQKQRDEWIFKKVTHSERDGRHLNILIEPNPNPKDLNAMYITKRKRHDLKIYFSKNKLPWKTNLIKKESD